MRLLLTIPKMKDPIYSYERVGMTVLLCMEAFLIDFSKVGNRQNEIHRFREYLIIEKLYENETR